MRILFVADGRSPIALNWIDYFVEQGHEIHLASTFPCPEDRRWKSLSFVPVAFSGAKIGQQGKSNQTSKLSNFKGGIWGAPALSARTLIRQWLGPLTLRKAARRLDRIISSVEPDLIHAMRIPYEGMVTALVELRVPLLISVWGNDFTLHAPATPLTASYTRMALRRANAIHTDCDRDRRLAYQWGFDPAKQVVVLPGAGGVQPEMFYPPASGQYIPERDHTVINPRGFRAYVRNDTFFRSIPLVLQKQPNVRFLCPAMAEEPRAWRWGRDLDIAEHVELLPVQSRTQMAYLFRRSSVAVSATTHDGTPNTLLEAMACGCLPVAGDIESIREWIVPGKNGLLFDPLDHRALAREILHSLEDEILRQNALEYNTRLIAEKAAYPVVMARALDFYVSLSGRNPTIVKEI
jgi:glycosyltransferase involved in cell wall biosynthesis